MTRFKTKKYKSSINIYIKIKSHKTIVLKLEAEASGKRLHPCFITCDWDIIWGGGAPLPPPYHSSLSSDPWGGVKKKRKKEMIWRGLVVLGGNLLRVHKIQKYPGVRSNQTYTTAQEPTKVQCTNKKKLKATKINKNCKHGTINS